MATINQLVRNGRGTKTKKSKSPALNVGYNSKDKKRTNPRMICPWNKSYPQNPACQKTPRSFNV